MYMSTQSSAFSLMLFVAQIISLSIPFESAFSGAIEEASHLSLNPLHTNLIESGADLLDSASHEAKFASAPSQSVIRPRMFEHDGISQGISNHPF